MYLAIVTSTFRNLLKYVCVNNITLMFFHFRYLNTKTKNQWFLLSFIKIKVLLFPYFTFLLIVYIVKTQVLIYIHFIIYNLFC